MLPTDGALILVGFTLALVAARYCFEEVVLRRHAIAFRYIATVPWPMRNKIPRPTYYLTIPSVFILTKLATLSLIAPIMVGIGLWLRPEWVDRTDLLFATIYTIAIVVFVPLDRAVIRKIRAKHGIEGSWHVLLR